MTLVDTAGVHGAPADAIEVEGVAQAVRSARRRHRRRRGARSARRPLDGGRPRLARRDGRPDAWSSCEQGRPCRRRGTREVIDGEWWCRRVTGEGIERFPRGPRGGRAAGEATRDVPAITNVRHVDLLSERARGARSRRAAPPARGTPEEFVLADLNEARAAARGSDRRAHVGRCAARDLREILHRQVESAGVVLRRFIRTPRAFHRGGRRGRGAILVLLCALGGLGGEELVDTQQAVAVSGFSRGSALASRVSRSGVVLRRVIRTPRALHRGARRDR